MRYGTAQLLLRHGLVCDCLDNLGSRHEEVGGILDHEDEIGHRRRVNRTAGARAHDQRDLGHHARGEHIALEDFGIAGERGDSVLDPRAAGIVEPDHRGADIDSLIHDLADLLGMRLAERAAKNREILAEDKDQPAVHRAVAGDNAVARDLVGVDAEIMRSVLDEHVPFLEGIGVEQDFEPLACSELAAAVLGVDASGPAARARRRPLFFEPAENVVHGTSQPIRAR